MHLLRDREEEEVHLLRDREEAEGQFCTSEKRKRDSSAHRRRAGGKRDGKQEQEGRETASRSRKRDDITRR